MLQQIVFCLLFGHVVCIALLLIHSVVRVSMSLQACMDGGGANVFGIGSVNSAKIGDVSTSDWTFTMSYTNAAQGKTAHVSYTLAATSGTKFAFTSEDPVSTYVSWRLHLSLSHLTLFY